jgi:cytochrome c-type biogenesis protein CcmH
VSRRAIGAAALVALVLSIAGAARAQSVEALPAPPQATTVTDSALESRTAAVASTLRCPVCQGESIQESPAQLAQDMKAIVRDQLRAGKTPDEIRAYFVSRYGEWILLEPAMRGLNVLLYVFPVALVIGGLALVVVLVRRWSKAEATTQ